jgi:Trp operon repressor
MNLAQKKVFQVSYNSHIILNKRWGMFVLSFKNAISDNCIFKNCFFILQIFEVMGKKSDFSPRKVALIKVLLDQKQQSQREIAKRLQISQKSVNRVSQAVKMGMAWL